MKDILRPRIQDEQLACSTPTSVAPDAIDVAQLRTALAELGKRRLDHAVTETEFLLEREQIFDPLHRAPILWAGGRRLPRLVEQTRETDS